MASTVQYESKIKLSQQVKLIPNPRFPLIVLYSSSREEKRQESKEESKDLPGRHVHGRPQTFFQGRAKFSRGAKTYYLPKKHLKTYYFPLKKSKNILFWPARGGQGPLLALPCGRPWARNPSRVILGSY